MTTTYLDILMAKLFACAELNEDLMLRAREELRNIQKKGGILVVSSKDGLAWDVPYSEDALKSLVYWAEVGNSEEFRKVAEGSGGVSLIPRYHFDHPHYSEVVVL